MVLLAFEEFLNQILVMLAQKLDQSRPGTSEFARQLTFFLVQLLEIQHLHRFTITSLFPSQGMEMDGIGHTHETAISTLEPRDLTDSRPAPESRAHLSHRSSKCRSIAIELVDIHQSGDPVRASLVPDLLRLGFDPRDAV